MAVLVKKIPERRYQKIGPVGITQPEREQADRLNDLIENKIAEVINELKEKKLMPEEKGKGSLETYWVLGNMLYSVAHSKDFPILAELPLLWQNTKLYLPESLLYTNRGPYREHLWYCYRLGSYPKQIAKKMKWGEWVTIFDSTGINQEHRFDEWFQQKLNLLKFEIERDHVRMFAPCVNCILKSIDIPALSKKELFNCYEAAWVIAINWYNHKLKDETYLDGREKIQKTIEENFVLLDQVMDGRINAQLFASKILGF